MATAPPLRASARTTAAPTAPLGVGAAVAAATAAVALVSPEEPGTYPPCPFHTVTGWWCPGCGGLRAVHALAHGDLSTAVARNVLVVLAVPLLVLAWAAWLRRAVTGRAVVRLPVAAGWTLAATVAVFWVARNVPAGSWLAP
ncbi:DUF2752 domain-containing protein [Sporichthya polymorpha]|uniref:DUF2752 domain-containing protein n=1 Tax=Sporichthya polymorpha TaxID=35751 RepID=UPI000362DBC6|nr:DUF2752 domain-containing protein [Sporichthya polymorpha]